MKFKIPTFLSISIGTLLLVGFGLPLNNYFKVKEIVLMQSLMEGLNHLHYHPKEVNDDFSQKVYDLYLDRIDGNRRFLTQNDIKQLEPFRLKLDDEIKNSSYEFFDLAYLLLETGTDRAAKIYPELLEKPFDFSNNENIELDGEKKGFPKDVDEQVEFWRKSLKYDVLSRVTNSLEEQEQETEPKAEKKSFETLEVEAREAVKKIYDSYFKRIGKLKREKHLETYLNAITNIYDPHTGYFSPIEKENFDIGMSGKLEGIGARLTIEDELTKVSSIVPGGPSWKQGELKANDYILEVGQGNEEPVDVKGWILDDVVKLIRGKKGTKVKLTVKKPDGTKKIIPIIRDLVILEEGYAKSSIIKHDELGDKVGYIYLPRFYADFSNSGGRNCHVDIKKEIEKLQGEGVEGIILDLRNNGGGSLRDVVKMSGLFIEEGPIVQVSTRGYKPRILADVDANVQYKDPLIVLVNSFSASASEILAAALQDYGRAVIVGSTTFGKGTVQRFIDLDEIVKGNKDVKPLGAVKMTIQKFYRVNGGATQLKGVTPDIILPDNYQYIEVGEREREYPMEWTEIEATRYAQNAYKVENLEKLKKASAKRVKDNKTFKLIDENAQLYKKQRDNSDYPLELEAYKTEMELLEKETARFDNLMKDKIEGLSVMNIPVDMEFIQADSSRIARNDVWIGDLKKDVYLEEALHIMHDMMK